MIKACATVGASGMKEIVDDEGLYDCGVKEMVDDKGVSDCGSKWKERNAMIAALK